MTVNEINKRKYWVCCPLCDKQKCVKGTDKCDAEIWAKQKMMTADDSCEYKPNEDMIDMTIKSLEKQKAISELQPPTDDWESYADRLYDLAYLSGYNDGLVAKGNEDNNV